METKKQEAIRKAWGKYWEEVKDNVIGMGTHGGWANNEIVHYNEDLGCDSKGFEFENNLYRPKSLSGIENNNGWIAIESEEDLPKEFTDCFITNGNYIIIANSRECGFFSYEYKSYYETHEVTHYQPIIKPLPPLY